MVTSRFHTVKLFDQKGSRKTAITTTAKTKKTEMNKHEKQATVALSNEPIYSFVHTLTNSPQIISRTVIGKKSESKHF